MIEKNEFSKDIIATQTQNLKPVTITLTAIEVFAVVSAVQFADYGCEKNARLLGVKLFAFPAFESGLGRREI
jgi:hypothetical protein